jgi:heptosyltransferase-2
MPARVIVRLPNWLGDTVMAVPVLRSIRQGWPDAAVLAAGPWAPVLAGQGLADTLVTYPRAWRGRLASADLVRAFRGELAVVLPNSLEAALAAWYWGARRRAGIAGGGRTLLLTDRVALPSPPEHQVDEYLRIVEALGLAADTRTPTLAPPPPDHESRERVRRLLDDVAAGGNGPRVGIHLGAEYGPAKLWPSARVVEGCHALAKAGMTPVLLGAPRDARLAGAIAAAAGASSLVGKDEPALLPALLSEINALVAGDTGVAHLAAALGTPVVALFGPTDQRRTAPRGRVTTLTHPVPCAPCYLRACPIEHPCLAGVAGTQVLEAVTALLQRAAA